MIKQRVAALYLRCSTDKQDESIDTQRNVMATFADDNGYAINQTYIDEAISGTSEKRPAFNRMIADAEEGKFQFILVRDQSRFARFKPAKTAGILNQLDECGVRLVTMDKGEVDPNEIASFIVSGVESHGDNKHATVTAEKTITEQAQRVRAGWLAGQLAPFGFDRMLYDETGTPRQRVKHGETVAKPRTWRAKLVPSDDLEIVQTVRWIFDTYATRQLGMRGIANQLNLRGVPTQRGGQWSVGTIGAMLCNRAYIGELVWNKTSEGRHKKLVNGVAVSRPRHEVRVGGKEKIQVTRNPPTDWIVVEGAHQPIIDRHIFEQCQLVRHGRGPGPRSNTKRRRYPLSGLLICCHCGHRMHGTTTVSKRDGKRIRVRKYVCSGHATKGASCCDRNTVKATEVEQQVAAEIGGMFAAGPYRQKLEEEIRRQLQPPPSLPEQTAAMEARRRKLQQQIDRGGRRLLTVPDSVVPVLADEIAKATHDLAEVDRILTAVKAPPIRSHDIEKTVRAAMAQLDNLATIFADEEQGGAVVAEFVERVDLTFAPRDWGRKKIQRLASGVIKFKNPEEIAIAGDVSGIQWRGQDSNL
jgi:site-specific DNA recombinase